MRSAAAIVLVLFAVSCDDGGGFAAKERVVEAVLETAPAPSSEDAADDPAIWVSTEDPAGSLILGTDKQTGLYVYDLSGALVQSLPIGPLNNVDLRAGSVGAAYDLAVASNDGRNVVSLFAVDRKTGAVSAIGDFTTGKIEPYGVCLATEGDGHIIAVTYKDGLVQLFDLPEGDAAQARLLGTISLASQLEGCVFDETHQRLFIGEEAKGVWAVDYADTGATPILIDAVGGASGLVADVEGVSLWRSENGEGYLVVSAQGANRFIVYERTPPYKPLGAFKIARSDAADAVTGTDGIDIASAALGPDYPRGLLVVQDDVNTNPSANQNFKLVDWREIERALELVRHSAQ